MARRILDFANAMGAGMLAKVAELLAQGVELLFRQFLEIDEIIAGAIDRANELVELDLKSHAVAVLRVLDQEHHEKRDNGCRRIDDELPALRETDKGPPCCPEDQEHAGDGENHRPTGLPSHHRRKFGKNLVHRSRSRAWRMAAIFLPRVDFTLGNAATVVDGMIAAAPASGRGDFRA